MPSTKKKPSKVLKIPKNMQLYRVFVVCIVAILMLAGFMSLVTADPVVKFVLGSIVVFFVVKELY